MEGTLHASAEIHIASDSDFTIKCLTGVYNTKVHYNLIKQVLAIMDKLPKHNIHFHHVAGHARIAGNETADMLANEGALYSERSLQSLDLQSIAKNHGFNHQLIREEFYGDIT